MPAGIFDLSGPGLIFWEIVTFLVLVAVLYRFAYRPIHNRLRRSQQPIERSSTPPASDRIERLRYALMWSRRREPSRYSLWLLTVVWTFAFVLSIPQLFLGDITLGELGTIIIDLGLIGYTTGELLRQAGKRNLAALVWVLACLILFPLGAAMIAVSFYVHGTVFFTAVALLYWGVLPVWYGVILRRYLSTREGGA